MTTLRSKTPATWSCNVGNCGGELGELHILTDEPCPWCGRRLVQVTTTGARFCSDQNPDGCDWDESPAL